MTVPVYLIHWNAPDWVRSASGAILNSDVPVTVTVVDNGPVEVSSEMRLDERVRVITAGTNGGYSAGANIGLRDWLSGTAPYCVIGAHDLHVQPNTIGKLVAAADRSSSFGILGPKTDHHTVGRLLGEADGLEERYEISGLCLLLRRSCIEQIGLLDPEYGSYGEDNDLCRRAWAAGWKVGRLPAVRAHGLGTRSGGRGALQAKNSVLLAIKTRSRWAATRVIFRHLVVMLVSTVLCLHPGKRFLNKARVKDRWFGIHEGVPLLWKSHTPPPPAHPGL